MVLWIMTLCTLLEGYQWFRANLLPQSSRQKMETECFTEMLVATYQTAQCCNPEENNLYFHHHENFRSHPSTAYNLLIIFK